MTSLGEETRDCAPFKVICLLPRPVTRNAATHEAVPDHHPGGFAYFGDASADSITAPERPSTVRTLTVLDSPHGKRHIEAMPTHTRKKRPRDPSQLGKMIVDISVGRGRRSRAREQGRCWRARGWSGEGQGSEQVGACSHSEEGCPG